MRCDVTLGPPATPPPLSSFEQVYQARWAPLVRLAALTTGSQPSAEEIVQDAFVQLHRHWGQVENPIGWLRVVVMNGCRDWLRRKLRAPDNLPKVELVADQTDAVAVRDALNVLTPRQRAAVVLRYYEDLPEREIAAILKCRPGTVKSTLSQSLSRLAKELES